MGQLLLSTRRLQSPVESACPQFKMPTIPLDPSHRTLFKSTIRSTMAQTPSAAIPADPSGAWPSSLLSADHLEHTEWSYLAEGAKSIILRFTGDLEVARNGWVNHNGSKGLALRLSKIKRASSDQGSSTQPLVDRRTFEEDVIAPLLDSKSMIPSARVIVLPRNCPFLEKVAGKIEISRPKERRRADGVDIHASSVEAIEDLSWVPKNAELVAIEVRPKWLFSNDGSVSRTRKHQVLKRKSQLDAQAFENFYEPLDLISGDPERIAKAARGLVNSWKEEGNNLRVFVGGKAVDAGDNSAEVTQTIKDVTGSTSSSIDGCLCQALSRLLQDGPVQSILQKLAHLQATLAPMDIDTLASWWAAQTKSTVPFGQSSSDTASSSEPPPLASEPTLEELRDYVKDWLYIDSRRSQSGGDGDGDGDDHVSLALTLRQALLGYLLAMTFRDCSLFFRLTPQRASSTRNNAAQPGSDSASMPRVQEQTATSATMQSDEEAGAYVASDSTLSIFPSASASLADHDPDGESTPRLPFTYTVKLIDVDIKSMSKLGHWRQLEEDIESAWRAWQE